MEGKREEGEGKGKVRGRRKGMEGEGKEKGRQGGKEGKEEREGRGEVNGRMGKEIKLVAILYTPALKSVPLQCQWTNLNVVLGPQLLLY